MHKRIEARVHGRVQKVMYRDFATRKARGLQLLGEVKNLPDGTVHVIAEGPQEALEAYLLKLKEGSILSDVKEVEVWWHDPKGGYTSFDITYE